MASSTSRLRLAPDDHSGMRVHWSPKTKGSGPAAKPGGETPGSGAGSTLNPYEGADMAKNTRGRSPSGSRTRDTGVKITPPTHSSPVASTSSTR